VTMAQSPNRVGRQGALVCGEYTLRPNRASGFDPERSVTTDRYRVAEPTMAMSKPAIGLPIKLIERVPVRL
jgi:hypothetical protein